jgi:hypothetical protein
MPPFQVQYLCRYRAVWRDAGPEVEDFEVALHIAGNWLSAGRPLRVVDARGVAYAIR